MSVFVITQAYDYEGESPLAVAASLESAKSIAEKQAEFCGYGCAEWAALDNRWELQYGSTQWVIREVEVHGYEPDYCESMAKYGRCGA